MRSTRWLLLFLMAGLTVFFNLVFPSPSTPTQAAAIIIDTPRIIHRIPVQSSQTIYRSNTSQYPAAQTNPVMSGNCIVANDAIAVQNITTDVLAAPANWWGAPDGPAGIGNGQGDTISGNVDFTGFLTIPPEGCPPANSYSDHAFEIVLDGLNDFTYLQSVDYISQPSPAFSCTTSPLTSTVWYRYDAVGGDGAIYISTGGSDYDTVLGIWDDTQTEIACKDDASGTPQSELEIITSANSTYLIGIASKDHPGMLMLSAASTRFADLGISVTATSEVTFDGLSLRYAFEADNLAGFSSDNADLVLNLPPEAQFISLTPTDVCVYDTGVVTCSLAQLGVNQSQTVSVEMRVPLEISGSILASASLTGNLVDPDPLNNTLTLELPVAPVIATFLTEQHIQTMIFDELQTNPYISGIDFALVDFVPEAGGAVMTVRTSDTYGGDVVEALIHIESEPGTGFITLRVDPQVTVIDGTARPETEQVLQCELLALFVTSLDRAATEAVGAGHNLELTLVTSHALQAAFIMDAEAPPAPSERVYFDARNCLPEPPVLIESEPLQLSLLSPESTPELLPETAVPIPASVGDAQLISQQTQTVTNYVTFVFPESPANDWERSPESTTITGDPDFSAIPTPNVYATIERLESVNLTISLEAALGDTYTIQSILDPLHVFSFSGHYSINVYYTFEAQVRFLNDQRTLIYQDTFENSGSAVALFLAQLHFPGILTPLTEPVENVSIVQYEFSLSVVSFSDYPTYVKLLAAGFRVETDEVWNDTPYDVDGRIVYVSNDGSDDELFLAEGTERIQLTDNDVDDTNPVFSPDGTTVAFETTVNGTAGIAFLDVGTMTLVHELPGDTNTPLRFIPHGTRPEWSPDGTRVAYTDGTNIFFAYTVGGLDIQQITSFTDQSIGRLTWSPDVRWVGYERGGDVWYLNAFCRTNCNPEDSTHNLTQNHAQSGQFRDPAWSPDGRSVAVIVGNSLYILIIEYSEINLESINPTWEDMVHTPQNLTEFSSEDSILVLEDQTVNFQSPVWSSTGEVLAFIGQNKLLLFTSDYTLIQTNLDMITVDYSPFNNCYGEDQTWESAPSLGSNNRRDGIMAGEDLREDYLTPPDPFLRQSCLLEYIGPIFIGYYNETSGSLDQSISEVSAGNFFDDAVIPEHYYIYPRVMAYAILNVIRSTYYYRRPGYGMDFFEVNMGGTVRNISANAWSLGAPGSDMKDSRAPWLTARVLDAVSRYPGTTSGAYPQLETDIRYMLPYIYSAIFDVSFNTGNYPQLDNMTSIKHLSHCQEFTEEQLPNDAGIRRTCSSTVQIVPQARVVLGQDSTDSEQADAIIAGYLCHINDDLVEYYASGNTTIYTRLLRTEPNGTMNWLTAIFQIEDSGGTVNWAGLGSEPTGNIPDTCFLNHE